ncbi:hypothetical protein EYC95_17635 [Pseudomonas sp. BGI-2]|nr:hypothetical protein EYC95_17635 [Pseudomonas sp. BGI-2]
MRDCCRLGNPRACCTDRVRRNTVLTEPSEIVPTLRVGMHPRTLRVRCWDAERPLLHSHAERGNDQPGKDHLTSGQNRSPPPGASVHACNDRVGKSK